jgi:hypothetical protein
VNTNAAHVTDAEAADMRASNDAHVGISEAADVTATKTATASRKSGTAGRRYSDPCGRGDCENFVLDFHDLPPFSLLSNQSGP